MKKVSNTRAEGFIADELEFTNSDATLSGRQGGASDFGSLPDRYRVSARAARYVVYSYRTPIGWKDDDGMWTVPDVGYSSTTSQHQYIVKAAWGIKSFPGRGRETVPSGTGPRSGGWDWAK